MSRKRPAPRLLAALLLAALLIGPRAVAEQAPTYAVIVNPEVSIHELDREFVARAFLKQITYWPDHVVIEPVDQPADSEVRRAFSADVLGRSVNSVRNGWVQAIFDGRAVPPPELESDEQVVSYVLKHRGAIGYVSARAALRGVHAVQVR